MQYLIYDPDYSSSVPYRWSNNTDLKIIGFFSYIQYFIFYTFTGYIFRVTFSPYGEESGYSLFDTFSCNGRLYIACLQNKKRKTNVKKVDFVALI